MFLPGRLDMVVPVCPTLRTDPLLDVPVGFSYVVSDIIFLLSFLSCFDMISCQISSMLFFQCCIYFNVF